MTTVIANPLLIHFLRCRAGRRLGRKLAVIQYVGRRSGERHALVAAYGRSGNSVRIRVGMSEHKSWWRNFHTDSSLRLLLAGQDYDASAHVVSDDAGVSVVAALEDRAP